MSRPIGPMPDVSLSFVTLNLWIQMIDAGDAAELREVMWKRLNAERSRHELHAAIAAVDTPQSKTPGDPRF